MALIVGGAVGTSETDVRDFERASDAWEWIDAAASRRGFRRDLKFGPEYKPK
jgi:hypothetical protein